MIFEETKLKGAFIIQPQRREDDRGYFARTVCQQEFLQHGLNADIKQSSISFNKKKGTFRGFHYQLQPYQESKIVTCTCGALVDIAIDLRPDSATYKQWIAIELSQDNGLLFYIPEGFAHGFYTLTDNTTVHYQITEFYHPEFQRGIRYDDPSFSVRLPGRINAIAEKDKNYTMWVEPEFVE